MACSFSKIFSRKTICLCFFFLHHIIIVPHFCWIAKDAHWNLAKIGTKISQWIPIWYHFVHFWIMSVLKQPPLKLKSVLLIKSLGCSLWHNPPPHPLCFFRARSGGAFVHLVWRRAHLALSSSSQFVFLLFRCFQSYSAQAQSVCVFCFSVVFENSLCLMGRRSANSYLPIFMIFLMPQRHANIWTVHMQC